MNHRVDGAWQHPERGPEVRTLCGKWIPEPATPPLNDEQYGRDPCAECDVEWKGRREKLVREAEAVIAVFDRLIEQDATYLAKRGV